MIRKIFIKILKKQYKIIKITNNLAVDIFNYFTKTLPIKAVEIK